MSLFKGLGESREAPEELSEDIKSLVDDEIADSWGRVPNSWRTTITAAQVEEFLGGVAAKIVRLAPEAPARELTIYLLGKAESLLTGEGGGGGTPVVIISPDAGNRLEQRINGLYVPPNVDGGTFF